jgi:hypothetical protein
VLYVVGYLCMYVYVGLSVVRWGRGGGSTVIS